METTPTPQSIAEPGQSPGERLREFFAVLRRRWRLVAFVTLVTTGAALAVSLSSADQYDATAKLLLRNSEPIDALLDRTDTGSAVDPERETNTKVALIKLETVADRVSDRLSLDRAAPDLLDQVDTEVEGTSDIVAITARDRDPRRAADIANGFAQEYVAFRLESARSSLDEAADLARAQLASLSEEERISPEGQQLDARLRELEIASSLQTGAQRSFAAPGCRPTPRCPDLACPLRWDCCSASCSPQPSPCFANSSIGASKMLAMRKLRSGSRSLRRSRSPSAPRTRPS